MMSSFINIRYFILVTLLISASCVTNRIQHNSNTGEIEIQLEVVADTDGIIRTESGEAIGKIDKQGDVYDLSGNKIGYRKFVNNEYKIKSDN